MIGGYGDWAPYVPVAERRAKAVREMAKRSKKGKKIEPVEIKGRIIARSFWGKGWCSHLESFSDYSNRLPRGQRYARNGSVCHLGIQQGQVEAVVSGSELYEVKVVIETLEHKKWEALKKRCTGQISSLVALLQGELSDELMQVVADHKNGLFPQPSEISYECDCPDFAGMCKHIAAVMYGIGARLDQKPELLFSLRGVEHAELISASTSTSTEAIVGKGSARSRRRNLKGKELEGVFGVELEKSPKKEAAVSSTKRKTVQKKASQKVAQKKTSSRKGAVKKAAPKKRTATKAAKKMSR